LHFHIDQFHFPVFRAVAHSTVTTLHGRQDLPDLKPFYLGFDDMPLVSISDAQRHPVSMQTLSLQFSTDPFDLQRRPTVRRAATSRSWAASRRKNELIAPSKSRGHAASR
jgi:hypothetical protein